MRYKLMELGLKLQGRDVFKVYREMLKDQYNSLEENERMQKERLSRILLHAYEYVPYYRKILEEQRVVREGKVNLESFSNLPVLTKDLIRKNFQSLISKDPDFESREPYLNSSGGSTGEPVKFYQDNEVWKSTMATKWLYYSFVTDYPCKLLKLWGSERDILKGSVGIKSQMQNIVSNRVLLNSFKMTEQNMYDYVKKINKFKPEIIEAYAQSVYEFARFIGRESLEVYKPKGVITSAGTLYPEMRKTIEEVFGCNVYNRYGSREVGDIACSCSEGNQLHINNYNLYVEVLGEDFKPTKPGQFGRVYVTTLDNFSMPLIRYDLGDIAILSKEKACNCGRGSRLLEKVEGREITMFKTGEGGLVPGEFFIHFVGVVFNEGLIDKFQVVQEDYNLIVIKVVISNQEEFEERKIEIENSIKEVMGMKCLIEWEYVEDIKPLSSGKFLYVISKVK